MKLKVVFYSIFFIVFLSMDSIARMSATGDCYLYTSGSENTRVAVTTTCYKVPCPIPTSPLVAYRCTNMEKSDETCTLPYECAE